MSVPIHTPLWKLLWLITICFITIIEVRAFDSSGVLPVYFYLFQSLKGLAFLALGAQTPLAFWRFDSLRSGALACIALTVAVEIIQSTSFGHKSSLLEIGTKMALMLIGFAVALVAIDDGGIRLFRVFIPFVPQHGTSKVKHST